MSFGNIKENKFTSRLFFCHQNGFWKSNRKSNSQKCKRFDPNDYMLFLLRLYVCWISYWLRVKFQNIKFWKCSCPCFTPPPLSFPPLGLLSFRLSPPPPALPSSPVSSSLVHFSHSLLLRSLSPFLLSPPSCTCASSHVKWRSLSPVPVLAIRIYVPGQ